MICDRSAQFPVNCFQKRVIKTNNSGFNSTYLQPILQPIFNLFEVKSDGKEKEEKDKEQELKCN